MLSELVQRIMQSDVPQLIAIFIVFLCVGVVLFCFMEMASCQGKVIIPTLVVFLGLVIFGYTNSGLLGAVKMAAVALVGGWVSVFGFFWLKDVYANRPYRSDEPHSGYGDDWDGVDLDGGGGDWDFD